MWLYYQRERNDPQYQTPPQTRTDHHAVRLCVQYHYRLGIYQRFPVAEAGTGGELSPGRADPAGLCRDHLRGGYFYILTLMTFSYFSCEYAF